MSASFSFSIQDLKQCIKTSFKSLLTKEKKPINLILGNQALDLDSLISPLIYLIYLKLKKVHADELFVPVINFNSKNWHLKKHLSWVLEHFAFYLEDFLFWDQFEKLNLPKADLHLHLMDHHELPNYQDQYTKRVISIVDHHFLQSPLNFTNLSFYNIEKAGSNCSLLVKMLFSFTDFAPCSHLAQLFALPIMIDTKNLECPYKTAPIDHEALQKLSFYAPLPLEAFSKFQEIFLDLSHLSLPELLCFDYKEYKEGANLYGISSLPQLLKEKYFSKGEVEDSFGSFSKEKKLRFFFLLSQSSDNYRELWGFAQDKKYFNPLCDFIKNSPLLNHYRLDSPLELVSERLFKIKLHDSCSRKSLQPQLLLDF